MLMHLKSRMSQLAGVRNLHVCINFLSVVENEEGYKPKLTGDMYGYIPFIILYVQ
jgi:hypothetical protein